MIKENFSVKNNLTGILQKLKDSNSSDAANIRKLKFSILVLDLPVGLHFLELMPYVKDIDMSNGYIFNNPRVNAVLNNEALNGLGVLASDDFNRLSGYNNLGFIDKVEYHTIGEIFSDIETAEFGLDMSGLGRWKLSLKSIGHALKQATHSVSHFVETNVKSVEKDISKAAKATEHFVETNVKATIKNIAHAANSVIKTIAKDAGKVWEFIKKYSPFTILIRYGILTGMKLNFKGIANKCKYGYLTQAEAQKHNLDLTEWQKRVDALHKIESFYKSIGGDPKGLKPAILSGANKKSFLGLGDDVSSSSSDSSSGGGDIMSIIKPVISLLTQLFDYFKSCNDKKLLAKNAALAKADKENPGVSSEELQKKLHSDMSDLHNSSSKINKIIKKVPGGWATVGIAAGITLLLLIK